MCFKFSIIFIYNKKLYYLCRLVWLEEHKATNRVLVCQYLLVH